MNILVVGIGGVGGFYGGKLVLYASHNSTHSVSFYARKTTALLIDKEGLQLQEKDETTTVFPNQTYYKGKEIPSQDLVILCVKHYNLVEVLEELQPYITPNTQFLSLLNGISSEEIIQKYYPNHKVWNGFVFVFSEKKSANYIHEFGTFNYLEFGWREAQNPLQLQFQELLHNAQIEGKYNKNIRINQWKKFFFISTLATFTTYKNCSLGEVLEKKEYLNMYQKLLQEFRNFANLQMKREQLNFQFSASDDDSILQKIKQSNPKSTTSMQRDYYSHNKNELEALVGIIGKDQNYTTYHHIYQQLKNSTVV